MRRPGRLRARIRSQNQCSFRGPLRRAPLIRRRPESNREIAESHRRIFYSNKQFYVGTTVFLHSPLCKQWQTAGVLALRELIGSYPPEWAQRDGLLTLGGLDAPLELAASALTSVAPLVERLLDARQHTAGVVALDGVGHTLAFVGARSAPT